MNRLAVNGDVGKGHICRVGNGIRRIGNIGKRRVGNGKVGDLVVGQTHQTYCLR